MKYRSGHKAVCIFMQALFFFVSIDPGASVAQEDLYLQAANQESLRRHPQFVLIDDFNTGKFNLSSQEQWTHKNSRGSRIKIRVDRQDGRSSRRGYSLKAGIRLAKKQTAQISRTLNHLDVSRAGHLLFRSRVVLEQGFPAGGKITFNLRDKNLKEAETDITSQMLAGVDQWATIAVPLETFRGTLDLDQVISMGFRFSASPTQEIKGKFWFDEIAFFGEGNVNFESSKDNIYGFPSQLWNEPARAQLLKEKNDRKLLENVARDTWKFFLAAKNKKTQLITDNIKVSEEPMVSGYTSPTNIAMDLLATVSALELGFISRQEALFKIQGVLSSLNQMKRDQGFFFNFYETKNLIVTRPYISSVDNGWLAIALVVVRQAFHEELWEQAAQILDAMNFDHFFDPETNQLIIGYDYPMKEFGGHHYGMLVSEARATSLYAIGKGDIVPDHWWFLYRTPPAAWKWQPQPPQGSMKNHGGIDYFQGHYTAAAGKRFVPSWGGSLFEFLMPALVLKEKTLAPQGLGLNNQRAIEMHRDYAVKEKGYPVWGISPASSEDGKTWKYEELGVKTLGVKGYPDKGIVTPHVSFLALEFLPEEAMKNIRALLQFKIYGEYGFYDSLDVKTGKASALYLSLDQGMILVALCNYLRSGAIQNKFHQDPVGQKAAPLLEKESFFNV